MAIPAGPAEAPWWRQYRRAWVRGDVVAGVTVAAYLVPQVMAYASIAGVSPAAGLWASIAPILVYAALGTSWRLSAGPESSTALITGATIATFATNDPKHVAALAAALAIAVGVVCLIGWIARAGFFADLLSRPVLVGYMAGIAVLMAVSQLGKLLGFKVRGTRPAQQLWFALTHLDRLNVPTVVMAAIVIVGLLVTTRLRPHWPMPLLFMVAATLVSWAFNLRGHGLATVGNVPRGFPMPGLPDVAAADVARLLPPAFALAIVGYTDNVLTARAFRGGERIDPNREFLALGLANVAAGLSRGFPVSSSGSRTAIAVTLGGRTQLSSVVTAAAVVVVMLFAGPALGQFPMAALGGVVVYAATKLVDARDLKRIAHFRRSELALAISATVSVLVFDVLVGIGIAVGLSILDLLRRVARPHAAVLGFVPGVPGMHDITDYDHAQTVPGLVVYRWDSPLFFANAENFRTRALAAVERPAEQPPEWFLLNAEGMVEVDLTGIDALEEVRGSLAEAGIVFAMARVKHDLAEALDAAGFLARVGAHVYATLPTAVAAFHAATDGPG